MNAIRIALILATATWLTACGIKGGLYLPERPDIGAADGSKPAQEAPNQ